MSVLGVTRADPIGLLLETRFLRFTCRNGLEGLARPHGDRLDLLAVRNQTEKRGLFRDFIAMAKLEYKTICVFSIENPAVHDSLLRYGFTLDIEIDEFGDVQKLLRWDQQS